MELAPPLQRFVDYLPDKPRYADASKILGRIAGKELALERGLHLELASNKIHYLAFDVDYEGAGAAWLDTGMPPPTICTVNPSNGHAQPLFELEQPVFMPIHGTRAPWVREGPIAYFKAVRHAGIVTLGADAGYRGASTKNPLHPAWSTYCHDVRYSLGELADATRLHELAPDTRGNPGAMLDYAGRNDELFDTTRLWAYVEVRRYKELQAFWEAVKRYSHAYNQKFEPPLGPGEVNSVARSVSRWTWAHRKSSVVRQHQKNIGALGLEPLHGLDKDTHRLAKQNRQIAGAAHANHRRQQNTERNIRAAVRRLHANSKRITKAAVAREAGVSRDTVYRYQHLLDEARLMPVCSH